MNATSVWWASVIRVACLHAASSDTEIPGEVGVHVGFREADDLGREFDEWQAALPHKVVNRALADVQTPRNLRLGFVIRRQWGNIRSDKLLVLFDCLQLLDQSRP